MLWVLHPKNFQKFRKKFKKDVSFAEMCVIIISGEGNTPKATQNSQSPRTGEEKIGGNNYEVGLQRLRLCA